MLSSSMRYMDPLQANEAQGRIVPNAGGWQIYFSPKQRKQLESIAGKLLNELGYEVADPLGNNNPTAFSLWWWRMIDRIQSSRQHFRDYGIRSVAVFLRMVGESIIQGRTNRF